jgi:branched-chain amino acid transport system permease protein
MGNIPGVILGALLLTILPELLRYIGPLQQELLGRVAVDPADLRMLLFGMGLVLVMLFRPQGLWPSQVRARELSPDNPDEIRQEQEALYDAER